MMKSESQVCSLESAQKLRKLGVKQESLWYWIYTDVKLEDGSRDKIVLGSTLGDSHWELGGEIDTYSAFTVAELGEMLPTHLKKDEDMFYLRITGSHGLKEWYISYFDDEGITLIVMSAPTEAEARRLFTKAINSGDLVRLPCEKCGNIKSQGHHPDYSKPLDIIWLCKKTSHGRTLQE